ncbi:MAG: hypothetical protein OEV44_00180 [Spirochaetota bacterium]|nr:hypothetical protein [Spirochaetota bacterium]
MKDEKYIKSRINQLKVERKEILDDWKGKLQSMDIFTKRRLNLYNDKISAFEEVLN